MGKLNNRENITLFPFIAFDLETTGLTPGVDKIVEISGIKFQNHVTFSTFETLVDPEIPIPPETSRVHGITDDMVKGKPTIETVLPHFVDFTKGCVLMAHNIAFDMGFINAALKEQHLPPLNVALVDTLFLARKTIPGQPNYKLQTLASIFKIDPGNAHRARDDAAVCRDLFYICLSRVQGSETMSLEQLLRLAVQ